MSQNHRRWNRYEGLVFDEFESDSVWIREWAVVRMPRLSEATSLILHGEFRRHADARGLETGPLGAAFFLGRRRIKTLDSLSPGPFRVRFNISGEDARRGAVLGIRLRGVGFTNFLAWLGRVTDRWTAARHLQRFRRQNKNRQFRLTRLETDDGETVIDFSVPHSYFSHAFVRHRVRIGLNIIGFLTADLGTGESARCMVRAADATQCPVALIDLKLRCKNQRSDSTYLTRLQDKNPHPVNVVHIDPPLSRAFDIHHPGFRHGKYNIAYWAWELPEFPGSWAAGCKYFDEIWCPSEFSRSAIAAKVPLPVHEMPHAISFPRPAESAKTLRARFGLPAAKFLFLVLYDLNSYSQRKNPGAAIAAFRASGLAESGAGLVVKTHSTAGNETALADLRTAAADLPAITLLTDTFPRADIYLLEAACDCLMSLHRSEGFGLVVAECMYLGKPVIATDWSATSEFLDQKNGCPVNASLVALEKNYGPYGRGQTWAEPDIAHAAWWMQKLASEPQLCARLGAAARATIEEKFSPEKIGERYRRRLETIACW